MKKMFNEGNQIHNFLSGSGSGTVINYGSVSGSDFFTSYGSGSGSPSQKVTVPVPVRFRFHNAAYMDRERSSDPTHLFNRFNRRLRSHIQNFSSISSQAEFTVQYFFKK